MTHDAPEAAGRPALRIAAAVAVAVVFALLMFLLLEWSDGSSSSTRSPAIGLSFLFVLPAALAAFASYVSDPLGTRSASHYALVPVYMVAAALLAGFIFLQEGVVCIAMLAPFWLVAGIAGSMAVRAIRARLRDRNKSFAAGVLLIPLLAAQIEASRPVPVSYRTVTRETLIAARPEQVWPLLASIPDIRPQEGRWNFAQDILGLPRPTSAAISRREGTIVRTARWGEAIRFEELITAVRPQRSLEWRFAFPDSSVREHTDRHIAPDGAHLRIESGAYRLEPAPGARTRLVLETRYVLQSPVNFYAAWWGELLLGGIQDNVLEIVRARAEAAPT